MDVLTRIRTMAEAAWHEATTRSGETAASGGHGNGAASAGAYGKRIAELERLYDSKLQEAIRLRQHYTHAEEMAGKRGEQAVLALQAGEEQLARLALQEKLREETAGEQYREQYAHCQEAILALAEELRRLRTAGAEQRRGEDAAEAGARDTLRELGTAGLQLGREVGQALREAGRLSAETLKEAGGNLQHELHAMRSRLRQEWRQQRAGHGTGADADK